MIIKNDATRNAVGAGRNGVLTRGVLCHPIVIEGIHSRSSYLTSPLVGPVHEVVTLFAWDTYIWMSLALSNVARGRTSRMYNLSSAQRRAKSSTDKATVLLSLAFIVQPRFQGIGENNIQSLN